MTIILDTGGIANSIEKALSATVIVALRPLLCTADVEQTEEASYQ